MSRWRQSGASVYNRWRCSCSHPPVRSQRSIQHGKKVRCYFDETTICIVSARCRCIISMQQRPVSRIIRRNQSPERGQTHTAGTRHESGPELRRIQKSALTGHTHYAVIKVSDDKKGSLGSLFSSLRPFAQPRRFALRAVRLVEPSIHFLMRLASPTRVRLPQESSNTMITGRFDMIAFITRQRPASLI